MKKSSIVLARPLFLFACFSSLIFTSCSHEIIIYEVSFDCRGGSVVNAVEVIDGQKIDEPVPPTKSGYLFDGWYKESDCLTEWNFESDVVVSVMTLYGKWTVTVGGIGEAGGYVFYDDVVGFDLDSNGTIEDDEKDLLDGENDGFFTGVRYLEAAPEGWSGDSEDPFSQWGVDGYEITPPATATAMGTGLANTINIVSYHDSLRDYYDNPTKYSEKNDGSVAAKLCADYSMTNEGIVYDDWFLPSRDELNLMYQNLKIKGIGGFSDGWYVSSTELKLSTIYIAGQTFVTGAYFALFRDSLYMVRPVRTF